MLPRRTNSHCKHDHDRSGCAGLQHAIFVDARQSWNAHVVCLLVSCLCRTQPTRSEYRRSIFTLIVRYHKSSSFQPQPRKKLPDARCRILRSVRNRRLLTSRLVRPTPKWDAPPTWRNGRPYRKEWTFHFAAMRPLRGRGTNVLKNLKRDLLEGVARVVVVCTTEKGREKAERPPGKAGLMIPNRVDPSVAKKSQT